MPMAKTASVTHKASITEALEKLQASLSQLIKDTAPIEAIADVLIQAYRSGHKMVLFGNGGSAADAQHLATELLGGFLNHDRKSLPALALTTDTSALTAIGNDFNFETIFSRQVEAMVEEGDVVIALSTSGNSANVIAGAKAAKEKGATVVGFSGQKGGALKDICHLNFLAPSNETAHIQEMHIAVGHILCALVEKAMSESS